ncbi:MAG: hypothetical protein M3Z26_06760 [Bacteroidota bacterium]|nr:hypothetical protein [Bacteroidota bacterium]
MNQVLLETIVEKLESLEISLLKENKTGNDDALQKDLMKEIKLFQSEIAKLSPQFKVSNEKINELSKNIDALIFKLGIGVNEHIYHKHHLHKGVWIAIGFFITSLLLLYGWINCYNTTKAFQANDIKYRYLKVNGNIGLLKLLYHTDSLYNLNNDLFTKWVIDNEESLAQQAELLRLAGEKKERKILKIKAFK